MLLLFFRLLLFFSLLIFSAASAAALFAKRVARAASFTLRRSITAALDGN